MRKINRFIFLFILAAIILVLPTSQASAALARCRTDPIFRLSNGDIVTVTLDLSTAEANVRSVVYTLYVPAGVTVKQVIYTDGGLGKKETYRVYQNSPAKTYTTDTVVTTVNTAGLVNVIAYTRLNGIYTKSASGYNGQHLIVTISRP
jgi:hypothetical protein